MERIYERQKIADYIAKSRYCAVLHSLDIEYYLSA